MPHTSRTFGPFAFNAAAFRVERDGEVIALEPKALDVLLLLIERAPVVVEKGEIFGVVWKDVAVTDNALTRVIAQLRRALDDDARSPRYIETVATRGYRLIAPVGEWTPPMDRSSSSPAPAPDDSTLRAVWRRPWPRVAAAGLGFIAALVLLRPAAWPGTAGLLGATDGAVRGADLARHATLRPAQFTTGTGLDAGLAFARDASAVAFASDRTGVFEVYVQNLAPGAAPTRLTTSGRQNVQPAWSPDGQFVAYHEGAGGGIWVVPSRGGTARRVVPAGSRPAWSPDGRWIAFQTRDGLDLSLITTPNQRSFIGLLEVRTGNVRILTSPGAPPGSHVAPSWSPDGRSLLFVQTPLPLARSATPWTTTLWRMAADGTGLQRVALGEQFTTDYAATPDGRGAWVRARARGAGPVVAAVRALGGCRCAPNRVATGGYARPTGGVSRRTDARVDGRQRAVRALGRAARRTRRPCRERIPGRARRRCPCHGRRGGSRWPTRVLGHCAGAGSAHLGARAFRRGPAGDARRG
ncbi:MAG: winged helix-turn-helix domain-containing protein [Vicinamibacterales bacterium]